MTRGMSLTGLSAYPCFLTPTSDSPQLFSLYFQPKVVLTLLGLKWHNFIKPIFLWLISGNLLLRPLMPNFYSGFFSNAHFSFSAKGVFLNAFNRCSFPTPSFQSTGKCSIVEPSRYAWIYKHSSTSFLYWLALKSVPLLNTTLPHPRIRLPMC